MASGMSNNAVAGFRLSSQQERVWSRQTSHHVAVCVAKIDGPLRAEKLQRSVEQVVAEQEILRTVFRRQAGLRLPFQVIQPELAPEWRQAQIREDELQSLIARPADFDVEAGPILRVTLAE